MILKKNDIPIYTCSKTAKYIKDFMRQNWTSSDSKLNNILDLEYNKPLTLENIEIVPFKTSHDACMPCGYTISDKQSNKVLTFATDLGYVSEENLDYMKLADFLVLEANYDNSMLNYGSYPYPLKQRIKSEFGHLSNDISADTINSLVKNDNKTNFLLAHLSQNNNMIEIAKQTIDTVLQENNDISLDNLNINFATKNLSCEAYAI